MKRNSFDLFISERFSFFQKIIFIDFFFFSSSILNETLFKSLYIDEISVLKCQVNEMGPPDAYLVHKIQKYSFHRGNLERVENFKISF